MKTLDCEIWSQLGDLTTGELDFVHLF